MSRQSIESPVPFQCRNCGTTFFVPAPQLGIAGRGNYCSRPCMYEAKAKAKAERLARIAASRKPKIERQVRICETCGKEFLPKDTAISAANRRRYCSRACTITGPARYTDEERIALFWSRINKNGPVPEHRPDIGPCWTWTASTTAGYGNFRFAVSRGKYKSVLAHRFAWELENGPVPEGLWILHKCDNRSCCRLSHLFVGTPADNTSDMRTKGRHRFFGGELERLTDEQVRVIRQVYAIGGVTYSQLACLCRTSEVTISKVVRRESHRHIE